MRALRAGAIYAGANVASAAVPFLLLPLLTRALGPAEYGRVVSFALILTICMPIAGLSAHSAVGVAWFTRPRDEMPSFTGTALMLAAASTVVVAALAALATALVPSVRTTITPAFSAIAAVAAGATVVQQCRLVLWQSQHRPVANAALQIAASVLNVALSLLAVLTLHRGGAGRNAAIAAAAVAAAVFAVAHLHATGEATWSPRREHLRWLLAYGAPLVPHVMAAVALASADRWIVSTRFGPAGLGVYGAGAQFGMVMSVLTDAFVKAFNPTLYAMLNATEAAGKRRAVGAIYATIPAFLATAAAVGVALYWLGPHVLGPEFRAAASLLRWFTLGGAFTGVYYSMSGLYFFQGRTGLLAAATTTSAVVGASTTWALASAFGVVGAAAGYAATQGVLAVVTSFVAVRAFDLPWRHPAPPTPFGAGALRSALGKAA